MPRLPLPLLLTALCVCVCALADSPPTVVFVVDVRGLNATSDGPTMLAVFSAAGLRNRAAPTVFVYGDDYDVFWLSELLPNATVTPVAVPSFLGAALTEFGAILYDSSPALNASLLPSVVTMAGVLDAVPVDAAVRGGAHVLGMSMCGALHVLYSTGACAFGVFVGLCVVLCI